MKHEAYPGGPIGRLTGPEADEARKILTEMGFTDLGQIYKDDWDKRNALIGEMDLELTKIEELNLALGGLAGYINSIIPEDDDDEEEPPTEEEITKILAIPVTGIDRMGGVAMQHGGFTRSSGLAFLHPNEVIMPLNRMIDMLGMQGSGGLSIGSLSIPVSISGGSSLRPADVQVAITNAIRGRAGTELVRAGRRIGL